MEAGEAEVAVVEEAVVVEGEEGAAVPLWP